jgi:phage recombination protein Bet
MPETALAEVMKDQNITRTQIELLKKTIASGSTDDELALFLTMAGRYQLDPLMKQIVFIKAGGKVIPYVGIDGLRTVADRTGHYAPGDETAFEEDGTKLISATACVIKLVGNHLVKVYVTAFFDEHNKPKSHAWESMPKLMLAKCAEALALRKAFPAALSGLYEASEFGQDEPSGPVIEVPVKEVKEEKKPSKPKKGKKAPKGFKEATFNVDGEKITMFVPDNKEGLRKFFLAIVNNPEDSAHGMLMDKLAGQNLMDFDEDELEFLLDGMIMDNGGK